MSYAIVSRGAVVAGPGPNVRAARNGEQRLPVYDNRPAYNPITERLQPDQLTVSSQRVERTYTPFAKTLEEAQSTALETLATIRYDVETGGITLPNGTSIKTERDDQSMTNSAYNSLKNGLVSATEWKSANGWITVTLTELEPVATAVARHVAAAFGAERDVAEQIGQADLVQLGAMDIQNEFRAAYSARLQALNA